MATILRFETEGVRKLVEHVHASSEFRLDYEGRQNKAILLVKDQGIYLMSSGLPALPAAGGGKDRKFVVFARGFDPGLDDDFWEASRDAVGGDDFVEHLSVEGFDLALEDGKRLVDVKITAKTIEVLTLPRYSVEKLAAEIAPHLTRGVVLLGKKGTKRISPSPADQPAEKVDYYKSGGWHFVLSKHTHTPEEAAEVIVRDIYKGVPVRAPAPSEDLDEAPAAGG